MNPTMSFSRADFESLLDQHRQLIDLTTDLEYQMYCLAELRADERVSDCQRAGGSIIGVLRDFLFRQDQQVMPLIESALRSDYQAK
jgi:hypothetical protein